MARPPTTPPTYTDDAVEIMRVAKRKHTPETALQALADEGWTLVRTDPPTIGGGSARWQVEIDTVFANHDGTVDVGAYDDMTPEDAIELGAALIAAGQYVKEDVE